MIIKTGQLQNYKINMGIGLAQTTTLNTMFICHNRLSCQFTFYRAFLLRLNKVVCHLLGSSDIPRRLLLLLGYTEHPRSRVWLHIQKVVIKQSMASRRRFDIGFVKQHGKIKRNDISMMSISIYCGNPEIGTVHIYLAGLVCTILSEKPDIYKPEHRNTEWCSYTFRNVAMWNLNSCQASVGFDILFVCSMVNQLQLIFLSYFQVNILNLIIWFTFIITETRGKIVQFHLYLWLWHGGSQSVVPPSIS